MVEFQDSIQINKKEKLLKDMIDNIKINNPYFLKFTKKILSQSDKRKETNSAYLMSEIKLLPKLLKQAHLSENERKEIFQLAYSLSKKLREQKNKFNRSGIVRSLLQEFTLSSQEGIALMCLAEALLRIPDTDTRDLLIKDKIVNADWSSHINRNSSLFINAITWGLLITGKLVNNYNEKKLTNTLIKFLQKSSEPIIRKAILVAMKLMGEQFVTGENINEALVNAAKMEKKGFKYSYDMLGEAALTTDDAKIYMNAYQDAINKVGKTSDINKKIYENASISIKLSALHPRYCRSQYERIINELYPRLLALILQAHSYNIGINIDAEESDKLEISLDILEKLCFEPKLSGWDGIGFVVQAYQKRAPYVIDEIIDLAKRSNHRLMVRLVKGAYWDTEIKRAQVNGFNDYPVYTKKSYTDISYIACARKLLSATKLIYPQFATHNAHTVATVYHLAGIKFYPGQYEFQCLHGMGEPLYQEVVGTTEDGKLNRPCRIYAPVGSHKTLLAYLVRRLLENGANTSFVNKISNHKIPIEKLISDPVEEVLNITKSINNINLINQQIPSPRNLYGNYRLNSITYDLSNEYDLKFIAKYLINTEHYYKIKPIISSQLELLENNISKRKIINPSNSNDIIGEIYESTTEEINSAFTTAINGFTEWKHSSITNRVNILQKAAELMEIHFLKFISVLVREAGKTYINAITEIRESIDFLRYYAQEINENFDDNNFHPLGIIICISPWNFPLAIFIGQIVAAIAAGNVVLAKPSEQTPIIAMLAVNLLHEAGIPKNVLQMLPGKGSTVGTKLINDDRINGVMFTGSTYVAKLIQETLCNKSNNNQQYQIPLIAETGGINAMIVDSSALTEQVVNDVIVSAFDSAGQRCSALRVLCLQDEIAEHTLNMLKGAMSEYQINDTVELSTDIGPLIDNNAKNNILQYIENMRNNGYKIYQSSYNYDKKKLQLGNFIQPTLIEIKKFNEIKNEVFGPVLHILRYKNNKLDQLINDINNSGYGLTLGLHTRIDSTISYVINNANVGNIYVNRNMIGAVVGVQPFGGERLSGTGPKAGGPLYLYRLLSKYPKTPIINKINTQQNININKNYLQLNNNLKPFFSLCNWIKNDNNELLTEAINYHKELTKRRLYYELIGPTGERNIYYLIPNKKILCLSDTKTDILLQLIVVLAIGCQTIIWPNFSIQQQIYNKLPISIKKTITLIDNWQEKYNIFNTVIFHGELNKLQQISKIIAKQNEEIILIQGFKHGEYKILPELLIHERTVSINTAAIGGNTTLMTLTE